MLENAWHRRTDSKRMVVFRHSPFYTFVERGVLGYNRMYHLSWWRHQMETFYAILALCVGNSPVTSLMSPRASLVASNSNKWYNMYGLVKHFVSLYWLLEIKFITTTTITTTTTTTSSVNSSHKGQWRGALIFSLICAWINGWLNNREADDLRRNHAHYDVIVMLLFAASSAGPGHTHTNSTRVT